MRPSRLLSVSPDEPDNRFLECADAAGADYLVTGNKRHFPASFGNTRVVNARELIETITPDLQR
jgi:predicted nucleic acid-binding protein